MNAGQFARRRALIEREQGRRPGYRTRAMRALAREAGAVPIFINDRKQGWRLPNGQVACAKRVFLTERGALDALELVAARTRTTRVPGRHYECPHCGHWHLTSH